MKIATLFGLLLAAQASIAQAPVHWQYKAVKVEAKTYEVHLTANVDPGWHLYSQQQPTSSIAVPTSIKFHKNPLLTVSGKPFEKGEKKHYHNEQLGIHAVQYEGKVDFVQKVKVKAALKTIILGSIEYQVCTDEKCLPPATIQFSVAIAD